MNDLWRLFRRHWQISSLFIVFAVVLVILNFMIPPTQMDLDKYQMSAFQIHLLQLTIVLPYIFIWFIGLVGYLRLLEYGSMLGDSKDGRAFRTISLGVFWFVLWLPLSVFVGFVTDSIQEHHPSLTADTIRFENYANLLLLAPASIYIFLGAKKLVRTLRGQIPAVSQRTTLFFIAFSSFYTFVTLEDSARRVAPSPDVPASYYMADWLIILTIVIPQLLIWYLGVQAVQFIRQYRRKVAGVIYRQALQRLAVGIALTVLVIVLLRLAQSLTNTISQLSLSVFFLLDYVLLAGLAVGYILMAKGARQLQTIEEA